ncbi:unnamed protein product [Ilex paraguariensis]|uniref:VQ domain-containing protein n=1 Tax=Ilex paraguariensis TaxID=185542 RepID=A0ABC8U3Q4_9AQUA
MDSGNSGSLQSSSGGDEEYDSRADSISAFMYNPTGHVVPIPHPPPQPPPPAHSTLPSSMLDPLPNYFDPMPRPPQPLPNPSSLLNLDMVWPKTQRSEPNSSEINHVMASSSSLQPFFGCQGQYRGHFTGQSPAVAFPPALETATPRASSSTTSDHQTQMVRNPKKRSRASRRAPTTVLTTDTTNFRAMVQEFTGIPAPPFTSSPFPRSRLDLFGTHSTIRSNPLDSSQPPYLLRPFAQKAQLPPPFVSSSSSSSFSPSLFSSPPTTNNITSGSTISASNSISINYQLPSELGPFKQSQSSPLLNMQNPFNSFQSLLQTPPKYPLANSAILGSKAQEIPSSDSHLKMGFVDELGLSHGHVNTTITHDLPNLVSSDGTTSRNYNNPESWGGAVGSNDTDQSHLRFVNGSFNSSRNVSNGKLNYSASSSNFQGDKVSENVSTRGEGMVESWICSSD